MFCFFCSVLGCVLFTDYGRFRDGVSVQGSFEVNGVVDGGPWLTSHET